MKRLVFVIIFLSSLGFSMNAQVLQPKLGPRAWKQGNVQQKDAISLTHIREADVFWSKRIWRSLDLRQKMNLVLYYPIDSATLGKRSFVQVLYDEFVANPENVGPDAVKVYKTYELRESYTFDELQTSFAPSDSVATININGDLVDTVVRKDFRDLKEEVITVQLMEDWFFDKQRSVLDVRILAIGVSFPVWAMKESLNADDVTVFGGWDKKGDGKTIWFYFPALRNELAKHECFKRHNDAARVSYDDIFLSRMFGSYIVKEENVYDRYIKDYTAGLDALLEAEKISNEIEEFEQVLWEY